MQEGSRLRKQNGIRKRRREVIYRDGNNGL
jgi:hypothetical protein